ncbi:MAG: exodeoxyribonuclease III [Aerococcus sp.]|nr:exodeoxyribonuclease III [Aerococcus sp.]
MKFLSWNVNGLRAVAKKGFRDQFDAFDADMVCLQETKLQAGQIDLEFPGYESYWNYAERKGYSGTVIYTRHTPLNVTYGLPTMDDDTEGRVITLEYPNYYLVTCYTPNAQAKLKRLAYRMEWESAMYEYLHQLDQVKPIIYCGDLNVAHEPIDLKNDQSNHGNPGFSDEERAKMTTLLDSGFTDTFRYFYPDKTGAYSWWSYRFHARENNAGWRIDYFIVSDRLQSALKQADILSDIMGSDHCPVTLTLKDA